MAPSLEPHPDALAAALADGDSIDWTATEAAAGSQATVVHQLHVIAAMRRRQAAAAVHVPWTTRVVAGALTAGVALATLKVVVGLAGIPVRLLDPARPPGIGPFALNLAGFGIGGLLLVFGGSRDRRLQLLGGFFLTTASAFVQPFLPTSGPSGVVAALLRGVAPEAFLALAIWLFAWHFPHPPLSRLGLRLGRIFIGVACAASLLMFVAFAVDVQTASSERTGLFAVLRRFNRNVPESLFWPLLTALVLSALPFLLIKGRRVGADARRRTMWFLSALAFGLTPMMVAVIATPFVPQLGDPAVRARVNVVVYLGLISIVPTTAFAVAVTRVMDLQFVIRTALQYALARYAIWAAIVAPLAYLALDVSVNRGLTFLQYVDQRQPASLVMLALVGLATLTFRVHLLRAVDRWFLREPLDPPQALSRLSRRFHASETLRDLSLALAGELGAVTHARQVSVALLSEDGTAFRVPDGELPELSRGSILAELLHSTGGEIQIDDHASVVRLLPEPDQDWLADAGARIVAPLLGTAGTLLGVVAVSAPSSDLPYTEAHLALITAMCSQAAMQLENRWLRAAHVVVDGAPTGVGWQDEPASCCPACGDVRGPEVSRCRCGAAMSAADLPLFVKGKFRVQRRLGAGGTGVVYLATDLALHRQVALKTLPPMRREYAERLRREARAMAAVRHPNLATIYGAEEWRDVPLLVVEYLAGGTLADALVAGPRPFDDVLRLGIVLADVLDRVHGSGVLHRDIKPSNIGYTVDGEPRLLDFGLAAMLDSSNGVADPGSAAPIVDGRPASAVTAASSLTLTHHVVGTPLYLSPEALAGQPPRESFDLWGLHVVLYEAVAGRHPLRGRTVPEVMAIVPRNPLPDVRDARPDCPAPVAAYLRDALALDPARRPATAAAARTALRELLTAVPPG